MPLKERAARDWLRSSRKRAVKWFPAALVFIMAAGGTFAVILLREGPWNSSLVTEPPQRAVSTGRDLGLRVGSEGDRLVLTWNRQSPFLQAAASGTLVIQDGSQRQEVRLDASQLADGSVSYKPLSSDVSFRLEVSGLEGLSVASIRVLDGTSVAVPAAKGRP